MKTSTGHSNLVSRGGTSGRAQFSTGGTDTCPGTACGKESPHASARAPLHSYHSWFAIIGSSRQSPENTVTLFDSAPSPPVARDVARTFRQVLGVECVAQAVCPHQVPDSSECGLHVIANVNAIINDHTSWFGRRVASLREMRRTDHLWDAATATTRGTPIHGGETLRMTNDEIKSTLTKCAPGTTIGTTWRYLGDSDSREWLGRVYEPIGRNEKGKWPLEFRIVDEDGDIASVQSQWPRPPNYNGRPVEILTIRRYGQELSASEVRRHHTGTVSRAQPGDTKARTIKGSTPRGDTRPEHQPTAATGQPATTGPRGDSRPRSTSPEALDPTSRGESRPSTRVYRAMAENPKERALPDIPFDTGSLQRLISAHANGAPIHLWRHVHNTTSAEKLEGTIVDRLSGSIAITVPKTMSLALYDEHNEYSILCVEFPEKRPKSNNHERRERTVVVVEIDQVTPPHTETTEAKAVPREVTDVDELVEDDHAPSYAQQLLSILRQDAVPGAMVHTATVDAIIDMLLGDERLVRIHTEVVHKATIVVIIVQIRP